MAVGRRSELGIARAIDDVVNRVTNAVLPKLALAEGFEFHAPQLTVAFDELLRGQR